MVGGNGEEVDWLERLVNEIRKIHSDAIERAGGLQGERTASLYAACARPFQTAFGEDAFPTPIEKGAALMHGIIAGHAFSDANKRTGSVAAIHMLTGLGYLTDAPSKEQVRRIGDLAIDVASGTVQDVEDIASRLREILGGE